MNDWLRAIAASVNRRTGTLRVTLVDGVQILVPLERINAVLRTELPNDSRVARVLVDDNGSTIEFPLLGVDFSVAEMLPQFLGIVTASAIARKAGATKSAARSKAARANGKKGGRPRKALATA